MINTPNCPDYWNSLPPLTLDQQKNQERIIRKSLEVGKQFSAGNATLAEFEKAGSDALDSRNLLVESNIAFAIELCRRTNRSTEDMVNEAILGMIKGAERYDGRACFLTYVTFHIRKAIVHYMNTNYLVSFPANVQSDMNKCRQAHQQFLSDHNMAPTAEELSTETQLPLERAKNVLRAFRLTSKADCITLDLPEHFLGKLTDTKDHMHREQEELEEAIKFALSFLSNRDANILRMYYGIGREKMTLEEIGCAVGCSKERIRQLKIRAYQKISKQEHLCII